MGKGAYTFSPPPQAENFLRRVKRWVMPVGVSPFDGQAF